MKLIKLLFNLFSLFHFVQNWITFKLYKIEYSDFPKMSGIVIIRGKGCFKFGKNMKIVSQFTTNPVGLAHHTAFYSMPKAIITIGDNVGISNSLIYARQYIAIEDNVLIGGGSQILDNDFHSLSFSSFMILVRASEIAGLSGEQISASL